MFYKYKNWIHTLGPLKYNVGNLGRGGEGGCKNTAKLFFLLHWMIMPSLGKSLCYVAYFWLNIALQELAFKKNKIPQSNCLSTVNFNFDHTSLFGIFCHFLELVRGTESEQPRNQWLARKRVSGSQIFMIWGRGFTYFQIFFYKKRGEDFELYHFALT